MVIHHVVLLKFKKGLTADELVDIRARLHALPSQISAISGVKAGKKIKHPMDRDFDEGVIFVFKDEAALREYQPHKVHRDYQAFAAPYLEEKIIFDILSEDETIAVKETTKL